MSIKQAEITPGVFSRVLDFNWHYTDQSKMSAVYIISSKNVVINNDIGTLEDVAPEFRKTRLERILLVQRLDNLHINHRIYIDRIERTGEEIEFKY